MIRCLCPIREAHRELGDKKPIPCPRHTLIKIGIISLWVCSSIALGIVMINP
jgi:hypothetical protein